MNKFSFIFPGQGSQVVGMGEDFFNNSLIAKEAFEEASERLSIDMASLLFKENELLHNTEYSQPAILLVSSIAHSLFEHELAIKPVFTMGHSLGEFSSLVAAKALSLEDAVELVHLRGKFMKEACAGKEAGMMVLLGLKDEQVEEMTANARDDGKQIWAANYNCNGQLVVAGIKSDLQSLESSFKEAGAKRALLLNMSVASHCPILEPASQQLKPYLEKFLKEKFICNIVSNVTAKEYNTKDEAIQLIMAQLTKPVLYKQSITAHEDKVELFIEFGAKVLKGLNKKTTTKETMSITDMASLEQVINTL